jgi:acyl carrier protein
MTEREKIKLIEEVLELEENSLTGETLLADIPEYDSMAKLTLIVMFDDEFSKKLTGEQIRAFVTVKDIVDLME